MVNKKQRKAMNKVSRALNGVRGPVPKSKIGYMTEAGALITSRYIEALSATGGAAQDAFMLQLQPTSYAASNDAGGQVLRNYQEYSMVRATLHYTPAVGTTTVGIVHMGYYDNPELLLKAYNGTYTTAELLALAKSSPISIKGPVWLSMELPASMSKRRARYATNSTFPSSRGDVDLEVHGGWIVATEGVPLSTSYGQFHIEYTATGYHLENNAVAGV